MGRSSSEALKCFALRAAPSEDGVVAQCLDVDEYAYAQRLFVGEAPVRPIGLHVIGGKTRGDVLLCGGSSCILISRRLQGLLVEGDYTGWGTYPIRVLSGSARMLQGYRGLIVHGRSGPVNKRRARILRPSDGAGPTRLLGKPVRRGWHIEPASWDGSDLFLSDKRARVLLSEAAGHALLAERLLDTEIVPANELRLLTL